MQRLARLLRLAPLTLLVIVSTPALAQAAAQSDAKLHFDAGTRAFKAGHYQHAVDEFEQARRAGMNTPALWYNLGVSYYRLGDYDKSETAFRFTARYAPMAPVAYYNIGLVELRRARRRQARDWFQKAFDETQDPKLRMLAAHMLQSLAKSERSHNRWVGLLYADLGHDDNVTLENTSLAQASGKSDTFAELFAATRGVLSGDRRNGMLLKAYAYKLKYNSQSQFDMTVLTAGLYGTKSFGGWDGQAGAYYTHATLGGGGYLGIAGLSVQATDEISPTARLRLRYRYHHDAALNNRYDYLNGNVHDLRAEGRWLLDKGWRVRAYYRLVIENRNDLRTATTFTSYSPTRHTVHVELTVPVAAQWNANGMLEYRRSRYADASLLASGQSTRREDNRWRERVTFTRQLNRQAALRFQYTHSNNKSNIAAYTYSRNVVSAAVEYIF